MRVCIFISSFVSQTSVLEIFKPLKGQFRQHCHLTLYWEQNVLLTISHEDTVLPRSHQLTRLSIEDEPG